MSDIYAITADDDGQGPCHRIRGPLTLAEAEAIVREQGHALARAGLVSADGWATGDALFEAPSSELEPEPTPRPREAACARCEVDLLYPSQAPHWPLLCTACSAPSDIHVIGKPRETRGHGADVIAKTHGF